MIISLKLNTPNIVKAAKVISSLSVQIINSCMIKSYLSCIIEKHRKKTATLLINLFKSLGLRSHSQIYIVFALYLN